MKDPLVRSHDMPDTKWADDAEYWDKVRQARLMSGEEKMLAGLRMFDAECKKMEDAIRAFNPDAEEGDVRAIMRQLVAGARKLRTARVRTSRPDLVIRSHGNSRFSAPRGVLARADRLAPRRCVSPEKCWA